MVLCGSDVSRERMPSAHATLPNMPAMRSRLTSLLQWHRYDQDVGCSATTRTSTSLQASSLQMPFTHASPLPNITPL